MATSAIASGAGLRHVRFYTLDENGYPSGNQTGSTGYPGVQLQGVKSFNANIPDVSPITHKGDDRPFGQDALPPDTLESATVVTAKTNLTADALLTDTQVVDVGEAKMGLLGSDRMGLEPQVCVFGWRQAIAADADDTDTSGSRHYIASIFPAAKMVPKGGSMAEGGLDENEYNMYPTAVRKTAWGEVLTRIKHGAISATRLRMITEKPLMLERFDGNGALVRFYTTFKPLTVAKTIVFVDGVEATVSAVHTTEGLESFTLSAAPASGAVILALYETEDIS